MASDARRLWFVVTALLGGCGGGPATTTEPNGFWLEARDGGAGAVVFSEGGELVWMPKRLNLPKIAVDFDVPCSDFGRDANGKVVRLATGTLNRLSSLTDGGWLLPLDFLGLDVNSAYRTNPRNDRSGLVGSVSAVFNGRFSTSAAGTGLLTFRVEYKDTTRVVATDEGSVSLAAASTCR